MSDYSDAILATSGLVAYWKLDETSGSTADDSSANAYTGTINGATLNVPSLVTGGGTAMDFDGVNDWINIPYNAALNPTTFSIEAWVRLDGGAGTYRSPISSLGTNARGWKLYALNTNTWAFWVGKASAQWVQLTGPAAVIGATYHLVGTYTGGTCKFYVNGALVDTDTGTLSPNTYNFLSIGAGDDTNTTPTNYWFPGVIDEVALYNVALSDATVLGHYTIGSAVVSPPVVDAGGNGTAISGAAFTRSGSFTDADSVGPWTATVDYDDGAGAEALSLDGFDFDLAHTWATPGTYSVTVSVTDEDDATGADTFDVVVSAPPNTTPVVNAGADDAVVVNAAWTRAGSFTDSDGVSTDWTATVDYDDGDGPEALTLTGTTFDLSHTWTTSGAKTVTVSVEDDGGLIGTDTITVTVALDAITGGFIVSEIVGTHPSAPRISLG